MLFQRVQIKPNQVEKYFHASILLDRSGTLMLAFGEYSFITYSLKSVFHLNFDWKGSVGCEATADNNLKLLEKIFNVKVSRRITRYTSPKLPPRELLIDRVEV